LHINGVIFIWKNYNRKGKMVGAPKNVTLAKALELLQVQVGEFLSARRYLDALENFNTLLSHDIAILPADELIHLITVAHKLVRHSLQTKQLTQAADIYKHILIACRRNMHFTVAIETDFYRQSGVSYQEHEHYARALEYYAQSLWLAEKNTLTAKINQTRPLINKLLICRHLDYLIAIIEFKVQQIANINTLQHFISCINDIAVVLCQVSIILPSTKQFDKLKQALQPLLKHGEEIAESKLHVAKNKDLKEFERVVSQVKLVAQLLMKYHLWDSAAKLYNFICVHHNKQAHKFDTHPILIEAALVNDYKLRKQQPPPIEARPLNGFAWRAKLHEARVQLKNALNNATMSIKDIQSQWHRDLKTILHEVATEVVKILGTPPCDLDLIVLGSLAHGNGGAFSDVDCALLIAQESLRAHPYFQSFIRLFADYICVIGEPNGLFLDNGDLNYLTSNDNFLLNTPDGLAKVATVHFHDQAEGNSLLRFSSIYYTGHGESLSSKYNKALTAQWKTIAPKQTEDDPEVILQLQLAKNHLRRGLKDWEKLTTPFDSQENPTVNVKTYYITPLTLWCSSIMLYAGLSPAITAREALEALGEKNYIPKELSGFLQYILDTLWVWRVKNQLLFSQQQDLVTLSDEQIKWLKEIHQYAVSKLYEIVAAIFTVNPNAFQVTAQPLLQQCGYYWQKQLQSPTNIVDNFSFITGHLLALRAPMAVHRYFYRQLPDHKRNEAIDRIKRDFANTPMDKNGWPSSVFINEIFDPPSSDGTRNAHRKNRQNWKLHLLGYLDQVPASDNSIKVDSLLLGRGFYLKPQWAAILKAQQWVLADNRFTKKEQHHTAKKMPGNHLVIPFPSEKEPTVFFKVFPEFPLLELWRNDWQCRLGATVPREVDLWFWQVGQHRYPVLVSAAVHGESLTDWLEKKPDFSQLDARAFSEHILLSSVLRFEDNKSDNFRMQQLASGKLHPQAIDSDRYLVVPFNKQQKVQVKDVMLCLPLMDTQVDDNLREEFLGLNLHSLLSVTLQQLRSWGEMCLQIFGGDSIQDFYSDTPFWQSKDLNERSLLLPPLPPLLIRQLFEHLAKLQALFAKSSKLDHWQLIACTDNRLANHYKMAHEKPNITTVEQRFDTAVGDAYRSWHLLQQRERHTTTINFQSFYNDMWEQLPSKIDLVTSWEMGLEDGIVQLRSLQTDERWLSSVEKTLMRGDLTPFGQLPIHAQELMLKRLDFKLIVTDLTSAAASNAITVGSWQRSVIDFLIRNTQNNPAYRTLTFQNCAMLTDKDISQLLLNNSSVLIELTLKGCTGLTMEFIKYLQNSRLRRLIIEDMPDLKYIGYEGWIPALTPMIRFPSLCKLTIRNCINLEKIYLDAPVLISLKIFDGNKVTVIQTNSCELVKCVLKCPIFPASNLPEVTKKPALLNTFVGVEGMEAHELVQSFPILIALDWSRMGHEKLNALKILFNEFHNYSTLNILIRQHVLQIINQHQQFIFTVIMPMLVAALNNDYTYGTAGEALYFTFGYSNEQMLPLLKNYKPYQKSTFEAAPVSCERTEETIDARPPRQNGPHREQLIASLKSALTDRNTDRINSAISDIEKLNDKSEQVILSLLEVSDHGQSAGELLTGMFLLFIPNMFLERGWSRARHSAFSQLVDSARDDKTVRATLLKALINKESTKSSRRTCIQVFTKLGDKDAAVIAAFINLLDHSDLGSDCAFSLCKLKIRNDKAVEKMVGLINKKDSESSEYITALGELGFANDPIINALLGALNDRSESVRKAVIIAFGKLGYINDEIISALLSLFNERVKDIWGLTAITLARLGYDDASFIILLFNAFQDSYGSNDEIKDALVMLHKKNEFVSETAINELKNSSSSIRRGSLRVLIEIGYADEALINTILDAYKDEWDRTFYLQILSQLGYVNQRVIKFVSTIPKDKQTSREIVQILGKFGQNAFSRYCTTIRQILTQASEPQLTTHLHTSAWQLELTSISANSSMTVSVNSDNSVQAATSSSTHPRQVKLEH